MSKQKPRFLCGESRRLPEKVQDGLFQGRLSSHAVITKHVLREGTVKMSSITTLRTSQSVRFFDNAVALSLVQAFHRHLDIDSLLEQFYSQATATLQVVGMGF